jgi:hypothetical protein
VTGDGFFLDLLKVLDMVFCCRNGSLREGIRDSSGLIAHHEVKGRCIAGIVLSVVISCYDIYTFS